MNKIIKNGLIIEDRWTIISPGPTVLPSNFYVLPLAQWKHHECAHDSHNKSAGFWLMPDENIDKTAHLDRAKIIAVYFPSLTDGRGFAMGCLLRERYGFSRELRAFGAIMRDQLHPLQRCGFNAFSFQNPSNLDEATESLHDFSVSYQAAVIASTPLFRRRGQP